MKYLLRAACLLIAATLFTSASAQNTGAFLKFDLDGKTISVKSNELNVYNSFEPGGEDNKPCNEHVFYVTTLAKQTYQLSINIRTLPHTIPVAGKIPYVETVYSTDAPCPGVYLSLTRTGTNYDMFASAADNTGNFEITKVAGGWVEGKFDIVMPKLFSSLDDEVLHITNGSFRFKIAKETKGE